MDAQDKINWLRMRIAGLTTQRAVLRDALVQQKQLYRHFPVETRMITKSDFDSMRLAIVEDAMMLGLLVEDATITVIDSDEGARLMMAKWPGGEELMCTAHPWRGWLREADEEHDLELQDLYDKKSAPKKSIAQEVLELTGQLPYRP